MLVSHLKNQDGYQAQQEGLAMNEKLIGAEPCYCEKVNRDIILAHFEEEFITGDENNPLTMIRLVECLSRGEISECSICLKNTK